MIAPRSTLPAGCALYFGRGPHLNELERALAASGITVLPAESLLRGKSDSAGPTVLCVDHSLAEEQPELSALPGHVAIVACDAQAEAILGDAADLSLAAIESVPGQLRVLRAAFQLSASRREAESARAELTRSRNELTELNRLGMALMTEHNHDKLLQQILHKVVRLTTSDAGALYLIERREAGDARLQFKVVHCESLDELPELMDMTIAVDSNSLAGHVALTGEPLVVQDSHNLPEGAPYRVNMFVQEAMGYWMTSMLILPMIDHKGEVVGVLHLANRKPDPAIRLQGRADVERHVIPYSERDLELSLSLAAQAAITIENALLYAQIENLFECFVRASVSAIDQRDPSTAGHSIRVATLVTDLASATERSGSGSYRGLHFTPAQMRELRYAALLHDFGKVGVREEVLTKAHKLPDPLWARVETRFDLIGCTMALDYERKRDHLKQTGSEARDAVGVLDRRFKEELAQLERFWSAVRAANEPTVIPHETASILQEVARRQYKRPGGRSEPYLTPDELHYLQIPQGSLDAEERHEVETHAAQTFQFLSQIPWTDDLKHIAGYAAGHHEKLNGTGYPLQLSAENIPVQTRLITIADVFDALTAADRPYKAAVSADAAIDILKEEAERGLLDRELVNVLIESQVYQKLVESDWRQL